MEAWRKIGVVDLTKHRKCLWKTCVQRLRSYIDGFTGKLVGIRRHNAEINSIRSQGPKGLKKSFWQFRKLTQFPYSNRSSSQQFYFKITVLSCQATCRILYLIGTHSCIIGTSRFSLHWYPSGPLVCQFAKRMVSMTYSTSEQSRCLVSFALLI